MVSKTQELALCGTNKEVAEVEALAEQVEHGELNDTSEIPQASEKDSGSSTLARLKYLKKRNVKGQPFSSYSCSLNSQLQNAIICRNEADVRAILCESIDEVHRPSLVDGTYPIHHAVVTGKLSLVKLILHSQADVNAKTNDGVTCLHKVRLSCVRLYILVCCHMPAN